MVMGVGGGVLQHAGHPGMVIIEGGTEKVREDRLEGNISPEIRMTGRGIGKAFLRHTGHTTTKLTRMEGRGLGESSLRHAGHTTTLGVTAKISLQEDFPILRGPLITGALQAQSLQIKVRLLSGSQRQSL